MLPRLLNEIEELQKEYTSATYQEQPDGSVHIVLTDVPLPQQWEPSKVRILLIAPAAYPTARPTFHSEPSVKLKNSQQVGGKSGPAVLNGIEWCSFCWNPSSWDLPSENILRYLKFCLSRFEELK